MSALRAWRIAKERRNQQTVTAPRSASSLTVVSKCLSIIVALKPLSKAVIHSNYANKAMKRFKAVNRLAARHVKLTVVIQTIVTVERTVVIQSIVTVEQLPWLVPC